MYLKITLRSIKFSKALDFYPESRCVCFKVIDERKSGDITNWEELGSLDICLGTEFLVHTKGSKCALSDDSSSWIIEFCVIIDILVEFGPGSLKIVSSFVSLYLFICITLCEPTIGRWRVIMNCLLTNIS